MDYNNIKFQINKLQHHELVKELYSLKEEFSNNLINILKIIRTNITDVVVETGRYENANSIVKFICYNYDNEVLTIRFMFVNYKNYVRIELPGKFKSIDEDAEYSTAITLDNNYEIISIIRYTKDNKRIIANNKKRLLVEHLNRRNRLMVQERKHNNIDWYNLLNTIFKEEIKRSDYFVNIINESIISETKVYNIFIRNNIKEIKLYRITHLNIYNRLTTIYYNREGYKKKIKISDSHMVTEYYNHNDEFQYSDIEDISKK